MCDQIRKAVRVQHLPCCLLMVLLTTEETLDVRFLPASASNCITWQRGG